MFVHALAGAGLVDSAVPVSGSEYLQGWVARPAYAVGSGIERTVAGPFAVRLTGDYLRTSYADSAGAVSAQNNLRLTASIVFRLRERQGIAPSRLRKIDQRRYGWAGAFSAGFSNNLGSTAGLISNDVYSDLLES